MFFMILAFYVVPFVIVVVALVDIVKSEFSSGQNKLIWIMLVILFPVLGAILYYFIGRKQKIGQ